MSKTLLNVIVAGLVVLIAVLISRQILGLNAMFQPHTYDWSTGMPNLDDQLTAFQQANKRWPTNYEDLVTFMRQRISNFVPYSYEHIEFTTKPVGNLEITVYSSEYGTNRTIFKPSAGINHWNDQ